MALSRGSGSRLAVQSRTLANGEVIDIPAYDQEEASVLLGYGYTVSTSVTAVSTGNYLYSELVNPAGSGVNLVLTSRVIITNVVNGAAPPEYSRYATTATISQSPTPTAVTVGNRIAGGAASTATFSYGMSATPPTGTITASGFVPTGGVEKRIKEIVIIPPGGKLIYAVGGAGGGLAAPARIVMTFLFYTQTI